MRIMSIPFLKSFFLGVEGRDGMGVTDLETTPISLASIVSELVNIGRLGQTANGAHFLTWLYLLCDVEVKRRVQNDASDLLLLCMPPVSDEHGCSAAVQAASATRNASTQVDDRVIDARG
jgi:hypothetical protein